MLQILLLFATGAGAAALARIFLAPSRRSPELPRPGAILKRHPEADVVRQDGDHVLSIPGQPEGLALGPLARRCWELLDGSRTLRRIAWHLAGERGLKPRVALGEIRLLARRLKTSLLALESTEWRLVHTHRLDVFAGCSDEGLVERRLSDTLIVHAASEILSPGGGIEPWRGSAPARRAAAARMGRHLRREKPLKEAAALFRRGWDLCGKGDLEEAEGVYAKSARLAPGWANAHYQLGYVRLRLRRYDEAARSLEKADRISPGYYMVREYIDHARRLLSGELAWEAFRLFDMANAAGLTDPDRTIRLAARALEISPEFPSARLILARAYEKKEELDRALGELSRTIRMNPDKATLCHALFSRGSIFLAQGRADQAMREWEKVLEINGSATATRSALATMASAGWVH